MPDRDAHKKALEAYLEIGLFDIQWAIESLRDCSIKEFDQIVSELHEEHGRFVGWSDIKEIRSGLIASQFRERE